MKKWRQMFQWLFIRHIAAFEEELQPELRHQPPAHPEVVRLSLQRHFRTAQPGQHYMLEYDPRYETIVEELRQEGWQINLQVEGDGELAYCISGNRAGVQVGV